MALRTGFYRRQSATLEGGVLIRSRRAPERGAMTTSAAITESDAATPPITPPVPGASALPADATERCAGVLFCVITTERYSLRGTRWCAVGSWDFEA